jgi:hypothetical protein
MIKIARNRSKWPKPALQVIANWCARREGIQDAVLVFHGTGKKNYRSHVRWFGRAAYTIGFIRVKLFRRYNPRNRRKGAWPYYETYSKAMPRVPRRYETRLELLVAILSHEFHHLADDGNPKKNLGVKISLIEHRCEVASSEAQEAFKREWPSIRERIYVAMRIDREAEKVRKAMRFAAAARTMSQRPVTSLRDTMRLRR